MSECPVCGEEWDEAEPCAECIEIVKDREFYEKIALGYFI